MAKKQVAKRALPEHSKKQIAGIKRARGDEEVEESTKKKRKGPKEPNSLSCKKKKKTQMQSNNPEGKKSRKRKRGKGHGNTEDLMTLIKNVTSNARGSH